jgi:hypothetical protein
MRVTAVVKRLITFQFFDYLGKDFWGFFGTVSAIAEALCGQEREMCSILVEFFQLLIFG